MTGRLVLDETVKVRSRCIVTVTDGDVIEHFAIEVPGSSENTERVLRVEVRSGLSSYPATTTFAGEE